MNTHISDEHWALLEKQVAPRGRIGRPRADDRQMLNAILEVLKSGCRWQDLPREYGCYSTAWRRLKAWSLDGTLLRLWRHLLGALDAQGKLDWEHCAIDGSYVRAKKGGTRWAARAGAPPPNATPS